MPSFFKELAAFKEKGLDGTSRVFISDRAHVVFDLHQMVDGIEETALAEKSVGTTRKGIGPTYSTKAARTGVRVAELFDWDLFESKLRTLARSYKAQYGDLLQYDVEKELEVFKVRYGLYYPSYFPRHFFLSLEHPSILMLLSLLISIAILASLHCIP